MVLTMKIISSMSNYQPFWNKNDTSKNFKALTSQYIGFWGILCIKKFTSIGFMAGDKCILAMYSYLHL